MPQAKLKARPALHREMADKLAERILSGELPEQSLLPTEREFAQEMGVSRTVVREAIKLLESRGLVRIERGRGTIVQQAHAGPVAESLGLLLRRRGHVLQDLIELRKILEGELAGLAAERRTEADLREMESALVAMEASPNSPAGYVDADVAFHDTIFRAAQNPVILLVLEPLGELLRESRLRSFAGARMVRMRIRQHSAILAAIRAGDAAAARDAMRQHIQDTKKDLDSRAT